MSFDMASLDGIACKVKHSWDYELNGDRYVFTFPNGYGASVVRNVVSRDNMLSHAGNRRRSGVFDRG